jgi:hypothetical protein
MICFKKMPNVVLTQKIGGLYDASSTAILARAFRRNGKLWCVWRGGLVLLKDDGTCVGETGFPTTWEAI